MPLPFILGAGAAIAGVAGVASGVKGGMKMKEANDTMNAAKSRHEKNIERFEEQNRQTTQDMDDLGKLELQILESFQEFSKVFEKIQNKPKFKEYNKDGVNIPEYDAEKLKDVSIGAGILLGGLGGAAFGTAGGFAAAGATTAAVMALGTASTGTAIASLSGVAATNATLAALGGGAIAAGGGGMALGSAVLGAATLGVGLLVGGVIFNITGSSLSDKADEAWSQMQKAEKDINKICSYLRELSNTSIRFKNSITKVNKIYREQLNKLICIIELNEKHDWNDFTNTEKLITENTALLVQLLYNMCKVELVLKSKDFNDMNKINKYEVDEVIDDADRFIYARGL